MTLATPGSLLDLLDDALEHLLGAVERGAVGQLHVDEERALVFRRQEGRRQGREEVEGAAAECRDQHHETDQDPAHQALDESGRSRRGSAVDEARE